MKLGGRRLDKIFNKPVGVRKHHVYLHLLLIYPAEVVCLVSHEAACPKGPSGVFTGPGWGESATEPI